MFHKGKPKTGGRVAGVPNQRTKTIEETALRLKCDPFEVLLHVANGDWKALGYDTSVIIKSSADGSTYMEYTITPELRVQAAKDACSYLYAKKKSIEHVTTNPLDGMTAEQKLEAMKQAVKLMEREVAEPTNKRINSRSSEENK